MRNVFVKESKIQGKGVFAVKRFHKGEEILKINDSHIVEDEATLTEEDWEYNADFFDGKIVIMQEPIVQGFFCKFDQVHPLKKKEQATLYLENSNMFCQSATHR